MAWGVIMLANDIKRVGVYSAMIKSCLVAKKKTLGFTNAHSLLINDMLAFNQK